jgi:PAS domain S-box-containing protein/putative nucleotidyltransferase with HDIG domain
MPQMDGFEFCRKVKEDDTFKNIPIVFYSAQYTDDADKALAIDVGAEGFITKPIEMDKFLEIIIKILKQSKEGKTPKKSLQNIKFDQKHYEIQAKMLDKKLHELEEQNKKLQESEANYKRLIEGLSGDYFIFRHDINGVLTYISPTVKETMGYTSQECKGLSYGDFLTPNPINAIVDEYTNSTLNGTPPPMYEVEVYAKDKTKKFLQISEHPLFDENENIIGAEGIAHNITLQKITQFLEEEAVKKFHDGMVDMIKAFSMAIEKRDSYTAGHQTRVSELAVLIANKLGWDKNRIEGLKLGALVHDIGKIAVPIEILSKPGQLLPIEFSLIQIHAQVGFDILKDIEFPWPIAQMIHQHHERIDGSGYPLGLKGDEMIEEAKILAIADVVEAVASHRPYRPALGIDAAIKEIKNGQGTLYDSYIVDICIEVLGENRNLFD